MAYIWSSHRLSAFFDGFGAPSGRYQGTNLFVWAARYFGFFSSMNRSISSYRPTRVLLVNVTIPSFSLLFSGKCFLFPCTSSMLHAMIPDWGGWNEHFLLGRLRLRCALGPACGGAQPRRNPPPPPALCESPLADRQALCDRSTRTRGSSLDVGSWPLDPWRILADISPTCGAGSVQGSIMRAGRWPASHL